MKEKNGKEKENTGGKGTASFESLTKRLADCIQPLARERHLHFRYMTEKLTASEVDADEDLLYHILEGFLKDAASGLEAGGSIIFGVRELWRHEKTIAAEFYIQDDGRQMHVVGEESQQLATSIGGAVTCESGRGMGTVVRFVVQLPIVVDADPGRMSTPAHDLYGFSDKHILVVEDHPLNLEIVRDMVLATGAEVLTASEGFEALEMYEKHGDIIDLVLMDIRMPMMDGIEATRRIRMSGFHAGDTVPIIALTASAYEGDVIRAMEAGMNEALLKPVDPSKLYRAMSKYLFE